MKTYTIHYWCPGVLYRSDAYTMTVCEADLAISLNTLHFNGWWTEVV